MVVDFLRSFIKYLRIHRYPAIFNLNFLIKPPGIILCDHHVSFWSQKAFLIRDNRNDREVSSLIFMHLHWLCDNFKCHVFI